MQVNQVLTAAIAAALTIVGVMPALASPLTLVEQGQAKAVIMIPAEAAPQSQTQPSASQSTTRPAASPKTKVRIAAEALQTHIEKMSGAKLPIVVEGEADARRNEAAILVGHTAAARELGVRIPSGFDRSVREHPFDEEGYVLKTVGNQLIVAGNEDGPYQGTIYAAYALLERMGCRWYFPGEWGQIIPEARTVTAPELSEEVKPDFASRMIWLSDWVPLSKQDREEYDQWRVRVGFSANTCYPLAVDGSLARLLPPDKYFATHPEYYAMNENGERRAGRNAEGFSTATTMLCLSNPEVFNQAVRDLREKFEKAGDGDRRSGLGFGISPPDGTPACYCPECRKQSQNFLYPSYFHRAATSEEFFGFAARLAREFPDRYISTMAYALREFPPQGVDLPHNLMVMYAPITNDILHPHDSPLWRHREFLSMLRQFRQKSPHLLIYDYNSGFLTGSWVPERDAENMAVNMPIYKAIGVRGFNREGRKAFMQTWLSYYVSAKLMWNANADVPALKREFYSTFFGADAGPHVQAWWDACAQRLVESPMQAHEDWVVNHLYDLAFVQSIQKHVDAARAAKASEAQRQRVETFALIAEHLLGYARMNDAEMRMDYAAAASAAQRMSEIKVKLHEVSSFLISPPAKPASYFSEGRKLRFEGLRSRTQGGAGTLIAPLPLEMRYARDPFNEGVPMEWYAPGFDDSKWQTRDTFHTLDQQEPPLDAAGHDWQGYGWYRGTFNVEQGFADKPVRFWCGGLSNEGWVWINGQYAGHRKHVLSWNPHELEIDVTRLIKPGQVNTITIRVLKDTDLGGIYRRGFFYTPKP